MVDSKTVEQVYFYGSTEYAIDFKHAAINGYFKLLWESRIVLCNYQTQFITYKLNILCKESGMIIWRECK
jgi:hypothetical protein